MATASVYYSRYHGNTKKLPDVIYATDSEVDLIDVIASRSCCIPDMSRRTRYIKDYTLSPV